MAGLGFKDFQVGEVLTSSDVDGYLMQQSVMRFADSAARGSALGTAVGTGVPLAEGMVTYLDDTNVIDVYDGSTWVRVAPSADTTQVFKTDRFTTTSTSFVDVTDLTVTITPTNVSSRVRVSLSGVAGNQSAGENVRFNILRDGATIAQSTGGSSGNSTKALFINVANFQTGFSIDFIDSPATTSSVTYKIQMAVTGGTGQLGGDGAYNSITTFTAEEVLA